jgi:hypothetical protein
MAKAETFNFNDRETFPDGTVVQSKYRKKTTITIWGATDRFYLTGKQTGGDRFMIVSKPDEASGGEK